MFSLDGITSDWSASGLAAKRYTPIPRSRLSRLPSSWHWSDWRWRSIWYPSEVEFIHEEVPMTLSKGKGIVDVPSNHSVDQTVERLKGILEAKGVAIFALIDHSGEAEKAGLKMPPTKLLIFGNPKGGTPLMLAAPSAAIDLPLKILVAESPDGKVTISYNAPEYLQQRHHFPADLLQNIAVVGALAAKTAE